MLQPDPSSLLRTLNQYCTKSLEAAAGSCLSRGHYEVTVEHLLVELLVDPSADLHLILRHYGVDKGHLDAALKRDLETERTGNSGRPVFSPLMLALIRDSWMLASAELRMPAIRSGALLATFLISPHTYSAGAWSDLLDGIAVDELRKRLPIIAHGSFEEDLTGGTGAVGAKGDSKPSGPHSRGSDTALGRFTIDFTAQAREGGLDPVIGREPEIRQCIDILARRRKNNPIIVGEAGVGKTALVEGIAQRVVANEVPELLQNTDILGLDMGLLQAGAGVKGEFENRLKGVIEEVKSSPKPIILFIDEAHTLIGAGGPSGGGDAANLLKPALARGELRTLAATTWSEYKKYFEKDPALTRRFQLVKVDEPSEENAVAMMRGLAPHYEKSHGVRILDEAVVAAVEMSNRYISGRMLPDKSIDLLDTCAARVGIAQASKPGELLDLERSIEILGREEAALTREQAEGHSVDERRVKQVADELEDARAKAAELLKLWQEERDVVKEVVRLRRAVVGEEETSVADVADAPDGEKPAEGEAAAPAEQKSPEELQAELAAASKKLEELHKDDVLVPVDVTEDLVARVVSDWTGIPLGKMVQDEAGTLLELENKIGERIKGQDFALKRIAEVIRSSKLNLGNPKAPLGVFLLVGPSGVGKTETAHAIADLLFGGDRFLVTINMSEFQEKHTVSRLIGSPPGYVGYGEGGVLTEAVRQRPYSAVILDEVEKADPEVMNIFYQVFDKGMLADGEGRIIDFQNTVILMTSNLGSDLMTQMCSTPPMPTKQQVLEAIKPALTGHFKPALLARMTTVPYFPLSASAMRMIVDLKLGLLADRLREAHQIETTFTDKVAEQILQRCAEVETGARNIDHILSGTMLPLIARALLHQMSMGPLAPNMELGVDESGEYTLSFSE